MTFAKHVLELHNIIIILITRNRLILHSLVLLLVRDLGNMEKDASYIRDSTVCLPWLVNLK